jgi:hypothetical protein
VLVADHFNSRPILQIAYLKLLDARFQQENVVAVALELLAADSIKQKICLLCKGLKVSLDLLTCSQTTVQVFQA